MYEAGLGFSKDFEFKSVEAVGRDKKRKCILQAGVINHPTQR